jgi:hypothetical protein
VPQIEIAGLLIQLDKLTLDTRELTEVFRICARSAQLWIVDEPTPPAHRIRGRHRACMPQLQNVGLGAHRRADVTQVIETITARIASQRLDLGAWQRLIELVGRPVWQPQPDPKQQADPADRASNFRLDVARRPGS